MSKIFDFRGMTRLEIFYSAATIMDDILVRIIYLEGLVHALEHDWRAFGSAYSSERRIIKARLRLLKAIMYVYAQAGRYAVEIHDAYHFTYSEQGIDKEWIYPRGITWPGEWRYRMTLASFSGILLEVREGANFGSLSDSVLTKWVDTHAR